MKSWLKIVFFIGLTVILVGCSGNKSSNGYVINQGAIRAKNIESISDKISSTGVRVFKYDSSIALNIPNQDFFIGNSANFNGSALDALGLVFALSKYQRGNVIAIIGYPPLGEGSSIAKALAKERARRVMDYLYRAGLSANFVYAESVTKSTADKKDILSDCVVLDLKDFY